MPRTVHKHRLLTGEQEISTHQNARVLHVAEQHNELTVWLDVDDDEPTSRLRLLVRGTGAIVPSGAEHLGSAVCAGGEFVFHVYSTPIED